MSNLRRGNTSPRRRPIGRAFCGICDVFEQASHNGDLVHAVEQGAVGREQVSQLGDVLIGAADRRTSADDITAFDSSGLAIQDLAIARAAMEKAAVLELPALDL